MTVHVVNQPLAFVGPTTVSIPVRNTATLPLQETEIQFDLGDPENNPASEILFMWGPSWARKTG